ncbi:MAG: YebC/PmpR family DNA-binding transcriptional regulator [Phycisphaeraceae bacterium]|nr:YebC/PmpR family DNA-binding transcriptional regulator [Phycisphaeraceae bacterium]
MAGHSKWANIRHRKERQDKKKGKIWSKCSKAIMVAARQGGGDPETNLALRYAIDEARYANMPKDTIQRAVDKGSGAAEGEGFAEITYEGYGPGGVAIIIDTLTDNRTRTVNDLRLILGKGGGSMGTSGSVAFMFETKGRIYIEASKASEEQLMEVALEAGAEDIESPERDGDDAGMWVITTDRTDYHAVRQAIENSKIEVSEGGITKIPTMYAKPTLEEARKLMNLIDAIEDNDDVQKVYHNLDEDLVAEASE